MIRLRTKFLRLAKEEREGRKLTLHIISKESGLSVGTIRKALNNETERISLPTLDKLCCYFNVKVISDLLEYMPEVEK